MRNRRALIALAIVVVLVAAACDTIRVSVSSTGVQGNGASREVSLSGDARLVAFTSDASNLVPGDTNGVADIFVRDIKTNVTSRVSVATSGAPANGESYGATISANGGVVAFRSTASNLVSGTQYAIYLRDLTTNTTTVVNRRADGSLIDTVYGGPLAVSATGRFVAFLGDLKIYRYDRTTGVATEVLGFSDYPTSISADGRYLATETLVFTGVHSQAVAVLDLTTARAVFFGPRDSTDIQITPDGRNVVYAYRPSCFPSYYPACTAGASGARLHNLVTGEDHPVVTTLGEPPASVVALDLSDNGQRVAVAVADQVYVFDRPTGAFTLVTAAKNTPEEVGNAITREAVISGDGSTVGFGSDATNLVGTDTNGVSDAFTRIP